MGLLDNLIGQGLDDPKSMATWQLVGGLLSPGSFGQGLSRGMSGYQGSLANSVALQNAQIEQQMHQVALQRQMQMLAFGNKFFGGGQSAAPSNASIALGQGSQAGSVGPTPGNLARLQAMPSNAGAGTSTLDSITPDDMAGGLIAGIPKDVADLWRSQKVGTPMAAGSYRIKADGSKEFIVDPNKPAIVNADGSIGIAPGGAATLGALAGATKAGEMRATNDFTPLSPDILERVGLSPGSTTSDLIGMKKRTFEQSPSISQQQIAADMAARGLTPSQVTVNTTPMPSGLKTAAQMEAEKLAATQQVHADTDPNIALRTALPKESHTANMAAVTNMASVVDNEAELVARNNRIKPFLDQLPKAGGWGYDQRATFANNLKNSGLLPDKFAGDVASWVANGGDPAAIKTINNQLASAAIQTMLDTLNKEGKPNRAIFQALHDEQEALKNGKDVLANVMKLQGQLYDQHRGQLGTMTDLMAASDYNPVKFPSQFANAKADSISGARPLPPNASAKNLTVGVEYQLPNGQTGTWNGFKFKGK